MKNTLKYFFLFVMLNLFHHLSLAQNAKIDSLLNAIKIANEDTNKIKNLNILSYQLINIGKYDSALYYAENAKVLSNKINDQKGIAGALNNIALVYYNIGEYPQALEYHFKSLQVKQKLKDKKGISASLNNIGNTYDSQGNYTKALEYYFQSLRINEEIGNKKGIASALNNIGLIYNQLGEQSKGLQHHFKALNIRKEIDDQFGISASLNNIGMSYTSLANYAEALKYYLNALKITEHLGNKHSIATQLNNIGNIYYFLENYQEALIYYFRALKIREEINDKYGAASSLINIGAGLLKQKKYQDAIKYLKKAEKITLQTGALNLQNDTYNLLTDVYSAMKQHYSALLYYKKYINIRDSLFNEENTKKLVQAEMNYEFEKKEQITKLEQQKKEVLHKAEVQQQKTQRNAFIAGFGLVLILAGVSFRGYKQKQKANKLLSHQKQIIEEKNKDITDSINYAQKIQQAILPSTAEIYKALKDSFIFYKPKDVVSGDFYAFAQKNGKIIIAAVDCTGHGVPGAFMSMIGNDQLNQIIIEKGITKPSEILTQLNKGIKTALKQSDTSSESTLNEMNALSMTPEQTRDGMDIALCSFDLENNKIEYAGAHRPLYLIKDEGQLTEIQADKTAIGGHTRESYVFTNHELALQKGDSIYFFTDGYSDQFGGDKGKKFMTKRFKELLLSIQNIPMKEQSTILEQSFEAWKANYEQVDDVLVIGIRI